MNKKQIKTLLIILGIIIITFFITKLIVSNPKQYFDKIELSKTNFVRNETSMNYIDTIVKVGLNKLNISGTVIFIKPLVKTHIDEYDLRAYIVSDERSHYIIYLNNTDRNSELVSLSHELIHLKQYYTHELVVTKNYVIWKNKKININEIPSYLQRPWEQDAFKNSNSLYLKIKNTLYKSKQH